MGYGWCSHPSFCSSSTSMVTPYVLRPSRHCAMRAGCCPGYGGFVLGTRPQKDGEACAETEGGHGYPWEAQGSVDRASQRVQHMIASTARPKAWGRWGSCFLPIVSRYGMALCDLTTSAVDSWATRTARRHERCTLRYCWRRKERS